MRLREDTGHLAHDACVAKLQSGQAIDQRSLFDEDANEEKFGGLKEFRKRYVDDLPDDLRD